MKLNPAALAVIRILAGYSQSELARKSGIGQGSISGFEAGKWGAAPSTLRKLAETLGVPVAALITDPTAEQIADALDRVSSRVHPTAATDRLATTETPQ